MIVAKITVDGVCARAEYRKTITAGIIGAQLQINYGTDVWNGMHKTVVFKGAVTKDVITDAEVVTIPAEVVAKHGYPLCVGVYGVDADGNLAIPTLWADIGTIRAAADPSGDATTDQSLPVWAQIHGMIGNLDELETTARDNLVAAVNEAMTKGGGTVDAAEIQRIVEDYLAANPPAPGEPGKDGAPGADGKDGITPTIGGNGNWYLGDTDTGKPSRGETGPQGPQGETGSTGPQGPQGEIGPAGPAGPAGADGAQGPAGADGQPGADGAPGATGATPNIQIGTVETLAAGSHATASMGGTPENPLLNLGIPQGAPGSGGSGIAVTGATVGQTIKIAAVDDNGVPTAWETVDWPSVGTGSTKWEPILNEVWSRNREFKFIEYDADTLTYTFPDGTFGDDEIGTAINTSIVIDPNSMPDTYGKGQSTLTPISGNQATIASAQHSALDGKNYWFEIPTALSIKGINARKIRVRWDGNVGNTFQNLYSSFFAYGMPVSQAASYYGYFQMRIARSIADIELELVDPYIVSGKQNAYVFGSASNSEYNKKWYQSYSPVMTDVSKTINKEYAYSSDGLKFENLYFLQTPWLGDKSVKFFIGNGTRIYVAREV